MQSATILILTVMRKHASKNRYVLFTKYSERGKMKRNLHNQIQAVKNTTAL